MSRRIWVAVASFAVTVTAPITSHADGLGHDMWTSYFDQRGMFTPHANDCASGESFIDFGPGSELGFCMEQNERTAASWESARDTCAAIGRRLPEPGEWKFGCVYGSGLTNMTDDWEWASNYIIPQADGASYTGNHAAIAGNGGCNYGQYGNVAVSNGTSNTFVYRCVR